MFAPQSVNGVALYAPRQWAITAVVLAVCLTARAEGGRAPLWLAGSGFVAGFAVYLDLFTLQMMPTVGVVALWRAVTVPRRDGGRRAPARLGRGRRGDRLVAGEPVADGAKAGLTLGRIGANWTLLVDQCLPYLLGVKVFVQDPVTLGTCRGRRRGRYR